MRRKLELVFLRSDYASASSVILARLSKTFTIIISLSSHLQNCDLLNSSSKRSFASGFIFENMISLSFYFWNNDFTLFFLFRSQRCSVLPVCAPIFWAQPKNNGGWHKGLWEIMTLFTLNPAPGNQKSLRSNLIGAGWIPDDGEPDPGIRTSLYHGC